MKERPILFSGEMVRAILDGRKTQTRRVVTRRNSSIDGGPAVKSVWDRLDFSRARVDDGPSPAGNEGQYLHVPLRPHPDDPQHRDLWTECRVYPRIRPGDRIYVKETWRVVATGQIAADIFPDVRVEYRAGGHQDVPAEEIPAEWCDWQRLDSGGKARPSIFMPRWASRILLEVTAVRVERVQEISVDDAIAEGCEATLSHGDGFRLAPHNFRRLWDSINLKRGYGWDKNPWVWVVEFKRVAP